MDAICDDQFMRVQQDPRNLFFDNDRERQERVEIRIKNYEDFIARINE